MPSMVNGDPIEEEPMTAALSMSELRDLTDRQDWTVDDLASLPEDLRFELIDGRLILSPSPLLFHQFCMLRLCFALEENCPEDVAVSCDQSVRIDSSSAPRPDVVLVREAGADRALVLATDVLLAVEVISPESSVRDRHDKLKLYADAGIPEYWIIDPRGERVTFTAFSLDGNGAYRQVVQTDGLVTIDRPWETTLDLPAWARRRQRFRAAARRRDR
jgi:Uma2 family endonuclease